MKFINLTPHSIRVLNSEKELVMEIPASGSVARVATTKKQVATIDGVPFFKTTFGEVMGLPGLAETNRNMIYVVSLMVKQASPNREDVCSPGELVRGADGQPIGCIGLSF